MFQENEDLFAFITHYIKKLPEKSVRVVTSKIVALAEGRTAVFKNDSVKTAGTLRRQLQKHYRVKQLGVLMSDSRTLPLRSGVTGVSLGYAGFRGLNDYRGTPDIFGRKFHSARVDVADSLATAADRHRPLFDHLPKSE